MLLKPHQVSRPTDLDGLGLRTSTAVGYLNKFNDIFGLNDTFLAAINSRADACGYTEFMENALQFPPAGQIPSAPSSTRDGCSVWADIVIAALYVNPCFVRSPIDSS